MNYKALFKDIVWWCNSLRHPLDSVQKQSLKAALENMDKYDSKKLNMHNPKQKEMYENIKINEELCETYTHLNLKTGEFENIND